jgi:YetA-like protein
MTHRWIFALTILLSSLPLVAAPDISQGVKLSWLDTAAPPAPQGVSWGVPWPTGQITKETQFTLTDTQGKEIPLQSWPLAYWPDGSIKWTGFATTAQNNLGTSLTLQPNKPPITPQSPIKATQTDTYIEITNGPSTWRIPKSGPNLVESISMNNQIIAKNGLLICQLEDRSEWETKQTLKIETFTSQIDSVTLEQSGPVRAVIKITGTHKSITADRAWLPFIVRLYFSADSDAVKMVHTFIFDGDQEKDFIHSLGVRFTVPLREQYQNRHVRLAGDEGFFAEPVRELVGRRPVGGNLYAQQVAGQRVPNLDQLPATVADMAVWDSYKLTQLSPDGFTIQKRTNPKSAWINAAGGKRSMGLAFVGDVSGGLSLDLKNFWQLSPTELEIEHASTDAVDLTMWLWSPESVAMDMRHYDTKAHGLEASYEDVQPGYSSAYGVARTSELVIRPYTQVPSDQDLLNQSKADSKPALLICSPDYYHALSLFGLWSLPNHTNPAKAHIEDQLEKAFAFYKNEIDQRRWYGFWDYGDVMHTYDTTRHEWRYDIGGFAWDDTELAPNLWLWYNFLRTGRADFFRMAENLTRQSQEVDVYHIGPWKGLGSRHNVRHWGDGAKEVRISQALFKRPYYYLTTDERTGDLMNEVIDADQALTKVDPLRELPGIADEHKYPTHIRIGPDWLAIVSNLYAAWERTGDQKYRDKIQAGIDSILSFPGKVGAGENFGYDPQSGKLFMISRAQGDHNAPSLLGFFGGPELMTEILPTLNDPAWTTAWIDFCDRGILRGGDNARLFAFAAYNAKDPKPDADKAWNEFLRPPGLPGSGPATTMSRRDMFDSHKVTGPTVPAPIDEINFISTNSTAQWCLNAIELLQLVGDQIPPNL